MDVILVDERDRPIGTMEKMEVHRQALLHRAFSVFIFSSSGEMLLQRRADTKYHSAGLWTNACCSHPAPGLDMVDAAMRRLSEEMGFTTPLVKLFDFIYHAPYENGLTEYEFDHVLIGTYDGPVVPNPAEVSAYQYKPMGEIRQLLQLQPGLFTEWFKIAFPRIEACVEASSLPS